MTHSELVGTILWVVIFYPIWSPRCRRIRRQIAIEQAEQEEAKAQAKKAKRQTGPAWEQDEPYQECFDEQEDDL